MNKLVLISTLLLMSATLSAQCPGGVSSSCDGSGSSLDLYWVGTTANNDGNWNDPCSWRVGSISGVEPCQAPRSFDNVFFTKQGFNPGSGNGVVKIVTQARCAEFFVDPSVNSLSNQITFSLSNPGFLEVYGSFTLQNKIVWSVIGGNNGPELYFKATTPGHTINTSGHEMQSIVIDGVGGGWELDNNIVAGCFLFLFGEFNTADHKVDLLTFSSHINPGASAANRKLSFSNSYVRIRGSSGNNRYTPYTNWQNPGAWESYNSTPANTDFKAGGSTIEFSTTSPFIHLGGLSYNVIHHSGTGRFYDHFGSQPCYIDTLTVDGYVFFHHEHNFNVLELTRPSVQHDFFRHQWIATDFIVAGDPCEPTTLSSEYNRYLHLPSSISSSMNGFIIDNLRCTVAGGGTQTVYGYGVASTTGWDINTPLPRDLYWVGAVNNRFTDARNWSTSPTGTPLLGSADCPPTLDDNVFFISPLADGDNVELDAISRCNDMTWNVTAGVTFSGNDPIYVYGDLQFDSQINFTTTSRFYMQGTNGNTFFSAGKKLNYVYWNDNSDYTLLDDLNFNYFYLFQHDDFSTGGFDLTGRRIYFRGGGNTNFSGSTITLDNANPWQMAGNQTAVTYNSASRLFLTYAANADLRIQGWGTNANAKWPTTEIVSPNPRLIFQDHLEHESVTVHGDLTINSDARFYAEYGSGQADGMLEKVTVNGDLNLNPGKIYEFGLSDELEVTGDINAIGPCASDITTIQGINGNTFDLDAQGSMNFAYVLIGNTNALGAHTLDDCTDLGGNTNLTFTPATGVTTYYWRARSGSCPSCVFDADWSSPGHWTTNAAATEGSAGCIPGPTDNVVFDDMSFESNLNTDITIASNVTCNNLTVTNSKVRFYGSGDLSIAGSLISDGTLKGNGFTGSIQFISANAGNTIESNGTVYGCNMVFVNSNGSWSLSDEFRTTGDLILDGGTFSTNDHELSMDRFRSSNTVVRTLNLGNSIVNVNGTGQWTNFGSVSNQFTWDVRDETNFSLNAGTSTINVTSASEPVWYSNNLDYHYINFTSTSQSTAVSPVILGDDNNTQYMRFDCSARLYGDHSYDTLHFTPGNVYILESNTTQTLNAPDGILIASGTPGDEIGIRSTASGSPSFFFKENTGGANQSFCFDYISVQDNDALSDDPAFSFFTGINSDDVSSGGIWDFTRPFYSQPEMFTGPDVTVCPGGLAQMTWDFVGSGPYNVTYQIGNSAPVDTSVSNSAAQLVITFAANASKEVKVNIFTADYCGSKNDGLLADSSQWALAASPAPIAQDLDSAICVLNNNNVFTHFIEKGGSERPILSIRDELGGPGLGLVTATTRIDATVQSQNGDIYLQRHYGITPEVDDVARIRLYFTQAELDALSAAWGSPLALSDLTVSKFNNDVMDFSGGAELMTIVNYGTANSGVTTSSQVRYLEFETSTFSHFLIHPLTFNAPLPVELLSFEAKVKGDVVACEWVTASERNNERFEVYRSKNMLDWTFVGSVQGSGTTTQSNSYELLDFAPLSGTSYYRLRQIDFNGEYEEFPPQPVHYMPELGVIVYPNPAEDLVNIQLSSGVERALQLELYSSSGVMINRREHLAINNEALKIDVSQVPPGVYTLRVVDKLTGEPTSVQFVVK